MVRGRIGSTLPPLVPTLHTLVKSSHRLVGTPDLHHVKIRPLPPADLIGTLHLRIIHVIPTPLPAQNVIHFLPTDETTFEEPAGERVGVRACRTGQGVQTGRGLAVDGEGVGAGRAEQ